MVSVKQVSHYYGSFRVLDNISFEVAKGEIVAFLGKNGAGKTTTMRIITGFMAPWQGDVYINGLDVFEEQDEVRKSIGYLPQLPPLYPDLTVSEYLHFVAELKKVPSDKISSQVDMAIERTDLGERRHTLIDFLSRGLKQRVGIAQSIVNSPQVLIMDEPTVGLDPEQVRDIRNLVRTLAREEGRTIILSTHILAEASEICEKAIIIHDGQIRAVDKIANLREQHLHHQNLLVRLARQEKKFMSGLKKIESIEQVETVQDYIRIRTASDIREEISRLAVEQGCGLLELVLEKDSLEDAFVKIIN